MSSYLDDLFGLRGKVVAISGAGGHLCSEMARGFASAGCSIAILDLRPEKAKTIELELLGKGFDNILSLPMDVCKKTDHQFALDTIVENFGKVDVLINGAGINSPTPFFDLHIDEWRSVLESHLTGTLFGCQVFGQHMLLKGSGSIINISSASASPPLSKAFPYSVAKAGIVSLTQNLGREWGNKGVRVNAIRPGFFPTEWNRRNFITPQREQSILSHTPMARYGHPSELIGATLWLASNASSFVTGSEVAIDGGFSSMTI